MKIACTADWHIHQFQEFSKQITVTWSHPQKRFLQSTTGKEMNSRLFDILNGICDLREYCVKNNIKYVLNAGDVFHKRGNINVETFNAAYKVIESFNDMGVSLICIAGNHDQVDSSDNPATSIHTLSKICTVIEEPSVFCTSQFRVCCLPYSRNKNLIMDSLDEFAQNEDRSSSILLAHLGVTGAAVGSGMYTMIDEYTLDDLKASKWKYVVLGHYHRPQVLLPNTFYCGTPVQNSFNDELPDTENGGYNGFFVIDTESTNVEFVPVCQPRFITVTSLDGVWSPNNYYRMKVTAEKMEDINSDSIGDNVKLELEKDYSEISRSSISLSDDYAVTLKKYVDEKYDGEDERILELGMEILNEVR